MPRPVKRRKTDQANGEVLDLTESSNESISLGSTLLGVDLNLVRDRDESSRISVVEVDSEDDTRSLNGVDEFALSEYIGTFPTKAVGIQYYHGAVTTSESVVLRREPNNAYDRNAIQVLNVNHAQVGHLPAKISMALAPWLDNRVCLVEASVKGKKQAYSIPLACDVFAHHSVADEMPRLLARAGIQINTSESRNRANQGTDSDTRADSAPLDSLRARAGTVDTRQIATMLDEMTVKPKDLQMMPRALQSKRLKTILLDYQLQGLHWMISKENPTLPTGKDIVQMWKQVKSSASYINIASNFTSDKPPLLSRGGLLADDMGLGKTLQILALVVATAEDTPNITQTEEESVPAKSQKRSQATLVLCPASLISNWIAQCNQHFSSDKGISVSIYHGSEKSSIKELASKELVISTYGTLKSEFRQMQKQKKGTSSALFSLRWKRVILDEAHQIRNAKSQGSLAVHALQSSRRWALSGTPVINSYNDLGAILRFVGWSGGLDSPEIFNAKLTRKLISKGEDVRREAVTLVKLLMQDLSLRRRKDMEFNGKKLVNLPALTEYHHKVKFENVVEQETYDKLAQQAKGLLQRDNQSKVLEILLRMRQSCCSLALIGPERLAMLERLDSMGNVEFTEENKILLQDYLVLAVEAQDTCPICLDYISDASRIPVVTHCKHVFCKQCISASIASKESCPLCRSTLKETQILGLPPPPLLDSSVAFENPGQSDHGSTKISTLLHILKAIESQDPTNKTVVFSQWSKFLDLIQVHLTEQGMTFSRLDGSMTLAARDAAIAKLQNSGENGSSILLATLGVASVGLNLTAANSVILCDPWWSHAIEDQAVDRVYRLGQTREVSVYKLVIEGSVEERVLEIQERKRKMTATLGTGQTKAQQVETRRADFQALFGVSNP